MTPPRVQMWKAIFLAGAALVLGASIIRTAIADPPSRPREGEFAQATREVPAGTGRDLRSVAPEGDWVSGNGVVEPMDREVRVAAEVPGRVFRVLASEGERVAVGDTMLELDSDVQRAQLAAAEADRQAAAADLARIEDGNRAEDVQALVAEAEAAAERARSSESVAARLSASERAGGATRDEADRAQRQAQVDRATANAADARRRAAVAGSRHEDIEAALARLRAAVARREQAAATLALRRVLAPTAGEVLQVKVRPGEYYQPGTDALVVIGEMRVLRARLDIDEQDVGRIRRGGRALVRSVAFPGRDFTGRVVEIARRMGRKNVRTDDPVERNDSKILEVVVQLDSPVALFVGQRVVGYLEADGKNSDRQVPSR